MAIPVRPDPLGAVAFPPGVSPCLSCCPADRAGQHCPPCTAYRWQVGVFVRLVTPGCRRRIPSTFFPHEYSDDSGIAIDPVDFRIMLDGPVFDPAFTTLERSNHGV
jgi:hypothetical protein